MENKTKNIGPTAYFCGLVLGFLIGHYLPDDTTRWQDILVGVVVLFTPLIWTQSPKKEE